MKEIQLQYNFGDYIEYLYVNNFIGAGDVDYMDYPCLYDAFQSPIRRVTLLLQKEIKDKFYSWILT